MSGLAFQYYSVMTALVMLASLCMCFVIGLNPRYKTLQKMEYMKCFVIIASAAMCEWIAVYCGGKPGKAVTTAYIFKTLEFACTPTVFLSWISVIYKGKRLILYRIIASLYTCITLSLMFSNKIVLIDGNYVYSHGPWYNFYKYIAMAYAAVFIAENIIYMYNNRKKGFAGGLAAIMVFMIMGFMLKKVAPLVHEDWVIITVGYSMLFTLYSALEQKKDMDIKTEVLLEELKLRENLQIKNEMVLALEKLYNAIYIIDLVTEKLRVISQDAEAEKYLKDGDYYKSRISMWIEVFCDEKYAKAVTYFLDEDTVQDRMEHCNSLSIDVLMKDGSWERETLSAIERNEGGYVTKLMLLAQEIGGEKERELKSQEALKEANAAAQLASKAKTTFLSNMSHDIRTPMNAVMGFASLALDNIDNRDKVKDCVEKIISSGGHLNSLINNILDMSRIESGKYTVQETDTAISIMVSAAADIISVQAKDKGINFEIDTKNVRNDAVWADSLKINQVLINLLGNAVKFTKAGGTVTFKVKQFVSKRPDTAVYSFKIADTGIGMSRQFVEHAFEPFEREKTSTVTGTAGTGLGLAISKSMIELMGGNISVNSIEGKGTEFIFQLVLRTRNEGNNADANEPEQGPYDIPEGYFNGRKILVAEDNELNREIAYELLKKAGFEVYEACDGEEAVRMLYDSEPGFYDAVLMDIQMPNMDGYQATLEIRNSGRADLAKLPIVATTANAFEEDRKRAIETGMNEHVSKPIDFSALKSILSRYM